MAKVTLSAEVRGAAELVRACARMEREAPGTVRDQAAEVADDLADRIQAAGRSDTRQSARAAGTVRSTGGFVPQVTAGPHPLLFGSEFGMTRHSGWYAKGRYYSSPGMQFRPHNGGDGYWFFPTHRANLDWELEYFAEAIDELLDGWPT